MIPVGYNGLRLRLSYHFIMRRGIYRMGIMTRRDVPYRRHRSCTGNHDDREQNASYFPAKMSLQIRVLKLKGL